VAKLFVTAVVEWLLAIPHIFVSVESQQGQPVSGLAEKNFTVARMGGGAGWVQLKDVNLHPLYSAPTHGFYFLHLPTHSWDGQSSPWEEIDSNTVFTVEVVKSKREGKERGQAFALNKCCGDFGMR
jgi:hypothetical protein